MFLKSSSFHLNLKNNHDHSSWDLRLLAFNPCIANKSENVRSFDTPFIVKRSILQLQFIGFNNWKVCSVHELRQDWKVQTYLCFWSYNIKLNGVNQKVKTDNLTLYKYVLKYHFWKCKRFVFIKMLSLGLLFEPSYTF